MLESKLAFQLTMKITAAAKSSANRKHALERGRDSLRKQAWGAAFSHFSTADREAPLDPQDVQALAMVAHLTGRETESTELLARAHQGFQDAGDTRRSAQCAFWLGFTLLTNGEMAQAGGWLARAARLLGGELDCAEQGYLHMAAGYRAVREGKSAEGQAAFARAASFGHRFGDKDLMTMAIQGQGRVLIRQGDIQAGVTLLDEAMVAVTAGEVSPIVAGGIYCSVLESCHETFDLRRAQEWTAALSQWCAAQPDLVPFRGHCLLQRAEILQLRGSWPEALDEAHRAQERLSKPTPKPVLGAAFYRIAELHRLRGEFAEAEKAYAQSSQWQQTPQPGFALLRFAQGQPDVANAAIRRAADEEQAPGTRSLILDALVEIVLATKVKDVSAARGAAEELSQIAAQLGAPILDAMSTRAAGAVLLAERDARGAHAALRQSWTRWCELDAPYEAARVRVLMGLACREQGDNDAANMELAAAQEVFRKLGAAPDLARVEALLQKKSGSAATNPLTGRELQVLRIVAAGKTNRGIAAQLGIREKTVARHLSNIFNKLDLSSRAAATAYAYQNNLV